MSAEIYYGVNEFPGNVRTLVLSCTPSANARLRNITLTGRSATTQLGGRTSEGAGGSEYPCGYLVLEIGGVQVEQWNMGWDTDTDSFSQPVISEDFGGELFDGATTLAIYCAPHDSSLYHRYSASVFLQAA